MSPQASCSARPKRKRAASVAVDAEEAQPRDGEYDGTSFFASKSQACASKAAPYAKYITLVAKSTQHYQQSVKELPHAWQAESAALKADLRANFPAWRLQLRAGFSLMLYGYGSKRNLVRDFGEHLADGDQVVVSAWRSGVRVTAKQIATVAASTLLDSPQVEFRGMNAGSIVARVSDCTSDRRVYVIINNIDAPSLRQPSEQAILASLAACRCIHLVATVDHVNAAALFDKRVCDQFQWLWYHTPTFEPMLFETLGVPPILAGCKQDATQRSATVVLKTLSVSSQKVFKVLVQALVSDILDDDEEPEGITHEHLFRLCRERFLVSSDVTLKSHLTEFKDHELVKTRVGPDGVALLYVPLNAAKLQALVDGLGIEAD